MTATVRPLGSALSLAELTRGFRRHYEHILLHTNQMLVLIPGAGSVLVTEDARTVRLDVVADSKPVFEVRKAALEAAIDERLPQEGRRLEWAPSVSIPVPFR